METKEPAPITQDEARASLNEINRTIGQMRKAVAAKGAPLLIIWGIIWIIGFGCLQFFPGVSGPVWMVLDIVGVAASFLIGPWSRNSPVKSPLHGRMGLSWLILFAYGVIWLELLVPWGVLHHGGWAAHSLLMGRKFAAFSATLCMFAYVIMGLWLDRYIMWLGVFVTIATLLGYLFLPNYFFLWLAITGGGALAGTGLFVRKFWR
jgi:hypothetical protein